MSKLISAGACLLLAQTPPAAAENLAQHLAQASRGGQFEPAPEDEIARAEKLFTQILSGVADKKLHDALTALDLELVSLADAQGTLIVKENANAKRGRGLYVLRPGSKDDVLQVPHAFKDRLTREIGLSFFAEGHFAAAAWNTVPRWTEENGQRINADMAHLPNSYFTAFTRAVGRHLPQSQVVQIHGFEVNKRHSTAGASKDLILSNGTRQSSPRLHDLATCLTRALTIAVGVFPDTVRELGATTNVQAMALRQLGRENFLHVEMNAELRARLAENASARRHWLDCVQK